MAFQGVQIILCVGADREELERFEDAGFTAKALEAATAAINMPAATASMDESVEAPLGMAAAAVESSVEAAVSSDAEKETETETETETERDRDRGRQRETERCNARAHLPPPLGNLLH
eukprot:COSAG03_NODE_2789_length_2453_cov_2.898895_1_plen_117_part_10